MKRNTLAVLLSFLIVGAMAVVACGSPTPTSKPTATPQPVSTDGPTPTTAVLSTTATPTPTRLPATSTVSPTAGPTSAPPPTGTLTIALASLATESLDPITSDNPSKKYLQLLYDYMIGATEEGKLSPNLGLVEKWERSADSKTWTFRVRKGVKFHNGDEVTAEDLKFSMERAMGPDATAPYIGTYRDFIGKAENMEVTDPYTLVFHLTKPYPFFDYDESILAGPLPIVVPKKYIQEKGKAYFATHPIGTGPYKFVEQVSGNYIKLEAINGAHWRVGVPKFKNIVFRIVPEESSRVAGLKNKEVDIIEVGRERMSELKTAGFNVFMKDQATIIFGQFIQPWEPSIMADKRVREAMNLAVNKEEMLKQIFNGAGSVSKAMMWSWAIGFDPSFSQPYPYDPVRARQLLEQAGAVGKEITIWQLSRPGVPELQRAQEAVAGYFSAVGLKPKLVATEYAVLKGRVTKEEGQFNGVLFATAANRLLVAQVLDQVYYTKGGFHSYPNDATLGGLIGRLYNAANESELAQALKDFTTYERENYLCLSGIEVGDPYATNDKVKQWKLGKAIYDFNLEYVISQK